MTEISRRPLGELELAIMEVLWAGSPRIVHEIGEALSERSLAYNTVMTTADRLYKKGLLVREKVGHAFSYSPRIGRDAYDRQLVAAVLQDLPTASMAAMLSGFLDFAASDDEALAELERLIEERKQARP